MMKNRILEQIEYAEIIYYCKFNQMKITISIDHQMEYQNRPYQFIRAEYKGQQENVRTLEELKEFKEAVDKGKLV
jgi:hypothetical protein